MLSIRMQRSGRKGHAMFRVVVQESRLTPTSGKVVALLGSYDPHAKTVTLNKDKATTFLMNGAQPSDRAAMLLKKEGVKLPSWVKISAKKTGKIRNAEKLRRNAPKAENSKDETPKEEAPKSDASEPAEAPANAAVAEASPKSSPKSSPEAETATTEA